MKRVIDTRESLGEVDTPAGRRELCVAADAAYDEAAACLIVKLDAFLRNTDLATQEEHSGADWLPQPETIRESAPPDETVDLARDIFHHWVRRVRQSAPSLHHA